MHCNDLEPTARAQDRGELQLEGVGPGPNPIDVVVEGHVPVGENQGEEAVRADLRQYFFCKSCLE